MFFIQNVLTQTLKGKYCFPTHTKAFQILFLSGLFDKNRLLSHLSYMSYTVEPLITDTLINEHLQ
jgi:hypothetical protein